METTGDVTGYIDVAQIMIYLFWAFFAGLLIYLRREDKREGYPLDSDRSESIRVEGFPAMPEPKVFALEDGSRYLAPHDESDDRPIQAEETAPWPGAPLEPVGDPMSAGVGPAAVAVRPQEPELTATGEPRVRPMRWARDYRIAEGSPDPRGMTVVGADGQPAGTVCELWVDLAESQLRYLEVDLSGEGGADRRLMPIAICRVDVGARRVRSGAILAEQFPGVPVIASNDQVTMMEEELITAYYGGGYLYATSDRQESLV